MAPKKNNQRNKKITIIKKEETKPEATNGSAANGVTADMTEEEALCAKLDHEARINAEARACTGSLAVHAKSRDIKISNFTITFFGCELLQDTMLELNCGRRYGLIGSNGCGKSSLLAVLGNREVPIPDHIDIFHLSREMPASSKTALECVMEVDEERIKLEKLAEELAHCEDEGRFKPPILRINKQFFFSYKLCVFSRNRVTRSAHGRLRALGRNVCRLRRS
jgi:ATP-binding cassette subfamily F protein 2